MLPQTLMCNADVGVVTHNWIHDERYSEPKARPFPDFSTNKKCRNFDGVMDRLQSEGGVKDLAKKFPMEYPAGATLVSGGGYATTEE